jgi:hypothetical protein
MTTRLLTPPKRLVIARGDLKNALKGVTSGS